MQWFRFYNEALNDPKVQKMPPEMFRLWVNLLCIASQADPRGIIPGDPDELAFILRVDRKLIVRGASFLQAQGLLEPTDDGMWVPHNWEGRQPESDDAASRMKRRRTSSEHVQNNERTGAEDVPNEFALEKKRQEEEQNRERAAARKRDVESFMDGFNGIFTGVWEPLKLTPARRKHIDARLDEFSVDQLLQAARNLRASPFHCGNNDKGMKYATPEFLCRNAEQVEKWLQQAPVSRDPQHASPTAPPLSPQAQRAARVVTIPEEVNANAPPF